MKRSTENLVHSIVAGVLAAIMFIAGLALGLINQSTHLVSDELEACTQLGGEYSLYWSDFTEQYRSSCVIPEQKIEDFNTHIK